MSCAPARVARSRALDAQSLAASRSVDGGAASHACSGEPNVATNSLKRVAPTPGRSDSASAACRERSLRENGVCRLYLRRLPKLEQLAPERVQQPVQPQTSGSADRVDAERLRRFDRRRLELAEQVHLGEDHAVLRFRELCGVTA